MLVSNITFIVLHFQKNHEMIDQTSVNTIFLETSKDQNIYLGYPASSLGETDKRHPEGYNKTGILLDVLIKDTIIDKVQFVMNYFNNK